MEELMLLSRRGPPPTEAYSSQEIGSILREVILHFIGIAKMPKGEAEIEEGGPTTDHEFPVVGVQSWEPS